MLDAINEFLGLMPEGTKVEFLRRKGKLVASCRVRYHGVDHGIRTLLDCTDDSVHADDFARSMLDTWLASLPEGVTHGARMAVGIDDPDGDIGVGQGDEDAD